jgi:hypothetical protein
MIFINEWFPNPTGNDTKGEFIELFNNGNAPVNLAGRTLKNEAGKKFELSGIIGAQKYFVLPRSKTKLTLKNSDASLFLYDSAGKLIDQSAFVGAAPEGESFSRINYGTDPSQHFAFTDPTPDAANKITANTQIADNQYSSTAPLNTSSLSLAMVIVLAVALSLALAGIMIYALEQDDDLSQLFFGKNKGSWRVPGAKNP